MSSKPATEWQFSNTDWDAYLKYRPPYPRKMYDTIYDFHTQKGNNSWSNAADVAAGIGVIGLELLDRFKHVTFSDVSEKYIEQARDFIGKKAEDANASFLVARGEELDGIEPCSLDMIVVGCAAHFLDNEVAVPKFAEKLKPGGTVALIEYSTLPHFTDPSDHELDQHINTEILPKWQQQFMENASPVLLRAGQVIQSRMDCIKFDQQVWKPGVKRVHWAHKYPMAGTMHKPAPSQVGSEDIVEKYERSPMVVNMDLPWMNNWLQNLYPSGEDRMSIIKEDLEDLKSLFTGPPRPVEYALDLVLAAKA